jgi:hypothetical protein
LVKHTIDILQAHAKVLGGCLISKKYTLNNIKLVCKCSKGHIFKADWHHIKDRHQWRWKI